MSSRPPIFWDSSALLDAIFARDDSPYYDLLALGETDAVDMRVSPDVLRECQTILRRHGEEPVSLLAIALSEANFATTPIPNDDTVDRCEQLTGYRNDARILAAAEECEADILITHDKQQFLGNPLISPPDARCRVMTAEDGLDWCLRMLIASDDQNQGEG